MKSLRPPSVVLCLLITCLFVSCASRPPLQTAGAVDLNRYAGTWYEVAAIPTWFQRRCASDTRAEYQPQPDGSILVVNRCLDSAGRTVSATGRATVVEGTGNARLKVRFRGSPIAGDYWIIGLDRDNYQWAVVGHPSRNYLWFLSRSLEVDEALMARMERIARDNGYDTDRLVATKHQAGK